MLSKIENNISDVAKRSDANANAAKKKMSIIKVISGIGLLFLCSQLNIPLEPVPVNMQTAGVLLISLTYARSDALITMLSFLALGAMGLPMFSNFSGGVHIFIGPTAGYLVGMLLCTYVVTTLRQKYGDNSFMKLALYTLIGSVSVFVVGIPYLAYLIGIEKAIAFGLLPFIIPGTAKALFVASSIRVIKKI